MIGRNVKLNCKTGGYIHITHKIELSGSRVKAKKKKKNLEIVKSIRKR